MTGHKPKPIVIWRISDGRPGHDSQSNGLTQSLCQLTACEYYSIEAGNFKNRIYNFFTGNFPPGKNLPGPDLIIGAGHGTHIPMLCAKRSRGGKIVVIMKPSLPYGLFDFCIIPEHDMPPQGKNIIAVHGALNAIIPGDNHDDRQGLVLIGGPSKHYSWNTDEMINQLNEITVQDSSVYWTISDSPRTPPGFMEKLKTSQLQNTRLLPYTEFSPGELTDLYAKSGLVWVSEDSVSMVFEALTSGAKVGILQVPRKKSCRTGNIIDTLVTNNDVTMYKKWSVSKQLNAPVKSFNESERCARFLYQQLACN